MVLRDIRLNIGLCLLWSIFVAKPVAADQTAFSPWTVELLSAFAHRRDVNAYCSAVVAQVAQNPRNVGAVIAEGIRRAPQFREAIIRAVSQAFPGFKDRIFHGIYDPTVPTTMLSQSPISLALDDIAVWSGEIELGGSQSTGNTDRDQASGVFKVKHHYKSWINDAKLSFDYARKDNETSARRIVTSLETRYDPPGEFYVFVFVQYEDDKFSGFDFETTESAGVGYKIIDTERVIWSFELGPGGRQSIVSDTQKIEYEIVGRTNSDFTWHISENSKITNETSVTAGEDRTTTENTIALSTTIIGELLGRISYQVRHSTSPVAQTKSTDTLSKISLAYQF